jgi:hypothetical protein
MGSNAAKLGQLRPVTFHLKTDPKGALQCGLIAEEVAKVYPGLVIRNESGRIDGVRYCPYRCGLHFKLHRADLARP